MQGLGLLGLLGFFLYNIIQHTPFALNDMQQGILSLITIVGIAVVMRELFPDPPKPRPKPKVIERIVYVEKEKDNGEWTVGEKREQYED